MTEETTSSSSTPTLSEFDPTLIPFQRRVIKAIRKEIDYTKGVHEILLSGSVGSAKSILMAHLVVTHCLLYPKSRALVGRQALPDLKDTLIQKIIEHIGEDLREGIDYDYNKSAHKFTFSNGSEIISRSWADKDFKRFRSLELSCAAIEELTENDQNYKPFYDELSQRVGRLPHVKESFIVSATNPDSPAHWVYKRFIEKPTNKRKVFYSLTEENPFLPKSYIEKLKEDLDPKMAQRMLYGRWVDVDVERIYYNYDSERNRKDESYEFVRRPIDIAFDFNIAENKPMSSLVGQYWDETFHCAKDYVVKGARTEDLLDEMAGHGLFEIQLPFRIFGDATGRHNDTRSKMSDYDIIEKYLANYRRQDGSPLEFELCVPRSNPAVRTRHNLVNGIMHNANGRIRCYVYKDAVKLDEGLRLTKLKKGGQYVEDDSDDFQHVTTAFGYWVVYILEDNLDRTISVRAR